MEKSGLLFKKHGMINKFVEIIVENILGLAWEISL